MDEAGVPYVLICPQRVGTYAHWDGHKSHDVIIALLDTWELSPCQGIFDCNSVKFMFP